MEISGPATRCCRFFLAVVRHVTRGRACPSRGAASGAAAGPRPSGDAAGGAASGSRPSGDAAGGAEAGLSLCASPRSALRQGRVHRATPRSALRLGRAHRATPRPAPGSKVARNRTASAAARERSPCTTTPAAGPRGRWNARGHAAAGGSWSSRCRRDSGRGAWRCPERSRERQQRRAQKVERARMRRGRRGQMAQPHERPPAAASGLAGSLVGAAPAAWRGARGDEGAPRAVQPRGITRRQAPGSARREGGTSEDPPAPACPWWLAGEDTARAPFPGEREVARAPAAARREGAASERRQRQDCCTGSAACSLAGPAHAARALSRRGRLAWSGPRRARDGTRWPRGTRPRRSRSDT